MYKKSFDLCAYNKMFLIKTKMLVFDMAGTTVNENGIVYKTLYETLKNYGLDVTKREIENWHGANKYEVIEHFLYKSLHLFIKILKSLLSFIPFLNLTFTKLFLL